MWNLVFKQKHFFSTFSSDGGSKVCRRNKKRFIKNFFFYQKNDLTIFLFQAVDTALLRELIANDQEGIQLMDLVADCDADPEEVCRLLESSRKFHSLAVHNASRRSWENAFCKHFI